jgi:hypothetical protein
LALGKSFNANDRNFQTVEDGSDKLFLNSSLQRAAELSGAAGEFRCQSLD